jgi:hypothetical protein
MEHKGVEYAVVQLVDGTGWRWEVRFGGGKNKSGVTPISGRWQSKLPSMRLIAS